MNQKLKLIGVPIAIIFLMLTLGYSISEKVVESKTDLFHRYNRAVKITDSDKFKYAFETNRGDILAQDKVKAIDTVTFKELDKEFSSIEKLKEKYVKVEVWIPEVKDSEGKVIVAGHWESHWEWQTVDKEVRSSENITFMDMDFKSSAFELPDRKPIHAKNVLKNRKGSDHYLYDGSRIRYSYYVLPKKYEATIALNVTGDKMTSIKSKNNKPSIIANKTIQQEIDLAESSIVGGRILFWLFWSIVIIATVSLYLKLYFEFFDY